MAIVKKTKQERKDTPLADSPEGEAPITDLKSALADINTRSIARQKVISSSNEKLNANKAERRRRASGGTLHGLASFADRTKLKQ